MTYDSFFRYNSALDMASGCSILGQCNIQRYIVDHNIRAGSPVAIL